MFLKALAIEHWTFQQVLNRLNNVYSLRDLNYQDISIRRGGSGCPLENFFDDIKNQGVSFVNLTYKME